MRKQIATLGLAAGLVAGGAGAMAIAVPAISGAQETTTTPSTEEGTDRSEARGDRLAEVLQPLVDDGTLTQEQADAVVEQLKGAMPGPGGHGPGRGPGFEAAAEALGMGVDELREALADGGSIAELAAERGVDVQVVVDALVAEAQTHLAERVAEGDLTQEQADERLAELSERITAMVNGERPEGGHGFGRGPGRFGPPEADDGTTDDGTTDDGEATPSGDATTGLRRA